MDDRLYDLIITIIMIINVFNLLLFIKIQRDINEFNKRQQQVNEYVINRVER